MSSRIIAAVDVLAMATENAYSHDTYGAKVWRASIALLLRRGYNLREVEAIMRSKWTRWAADQRNGLKVTSTDLARFMDNRRTAAEVIELTQESFPNEDYMPSDRARADKAFFASLMKPIANTDGR